ncbi:hypothetical protein OM076_14405 [Solirubrobacter ginsenosidimutans]|uniref:DUF11 domain-containing protein n=1 Tax=Solirubrobacter ginsenosidimutans TaxID=490573 RepID=A0A9X3MUF6_9ACTN|nr:hypothetical protein [Solirubrobacter ginsenosidimutans]MDA0161465.1 hypothetical protein [Solirubrobacter ginsenosidimutans]
MRRLIISTVIALALAPAGAEAHQSPAGCVANNLDLSVSRDRAQVRRGQTVSYTIAAGNVGAGACDITNATITFTRPALDGSATGTSTVVSQGLDLPAGKPLTNISTQQWIAEVDSGVTDAIVRASITGVLHDAPVDHTADVAKTVGITVVDPKLSLTVTPTPATGPAPLSVTFHYTLTNLSSPPSSLKSPSVNHPLCTPAVYAGGDADLDGEIDVGETWDMTCTHVFTAAGEYSSTATASATSAADNQPVDATAPSTTVKAIAPVPTAHLKLTKSATPTSGFAPLSVTYTYTVLNDGPATPISGITVTDLGCSPIVTTAANTPLAAGLSRIFTCTSVLAAGIYSSGAVATGTDTVSGTLVSASAPALDVTSQLPTDPDPTPTPQPSEPAPTPEPAAVPTATPTPVPTATPSTRVKFSYSGRFAPARSCRGTVTVALKAGTKTVATKRVKLDGKCRFKVSFDVARKSLGSATKVTLTAKAAGKRTATSRLSVPKT